MDTIKINSAHHIFGAHIFDIEEQITYYNIKKPSMAQQNYRKNKDIKIIGKQRIEEKKKTKKRFEFMRRTQFTFHCIHTLNRLLLSLALGNQFCIQFHRRLFRRLVSCGNSLKRIIV